MSEEEVVEEVAEETEAGIAVVDAMAMPLAEAEITANTLKMLMQTPTIPTRYRTSPTGWQDMIAAHLYGKELGIGTMTSIYSLYLVNGEAAMKGQLMAGLVQRAGHKIRIKIEEEKVTAYAFRRDYVTHELEEEGQWTFGKVDADRAGLSGKDNYQNYPYSMWTWRAVSGLCRLFFADVMTGLMAYVPEELGIDEGKVEVVPDSIEIVDDTDGGEELELETIVADAAEILDAEVVV